MCCKRENRIIPENKEQHERKVEREREREGGRESVCVIEGNCRKGIGC